ncbi:unnamed protein product [Lupinus luteus]|uniref:Uncharacterized protein n=1 Tax=Lupinus luteus TaxID=3873 RepID=A0AAV1XV30_LUPLU
MEYDFKKFSDILSGNYKTDVLIEGDLKKVTFSLKDFSGDVINCTMWESHVVKLFNYYSNRPVGEPMIILLTHARVKEGQGKYPPTISNSWSESKILIDEEIVNIEKYKQRKVKMIRRRSL